MNIHRFVTHSAVGLTNRSRLPFLSMTAIRRARNGVITLWTRFHNVCLWGQKETGKPREKVSNNIHESRGGCPEKLLTFACGKTPNPTFKRKKHHQLKTLRFSRSWLTCNPTVPLKALVHSCTPVPVQPVQL